MVYKARKEIKNQTNTSIVLDLTKHRYLILKETRKTADEYPLMKFSYADINCRLKIRFVNGHELFFSSLEEFHKLNKDAIQRAKMPSKPYIFIFIFFLVFPINLFTF